MLNSCKGLATKANISFIGNYELQHYIPHAVQNIVAITERKNVDFQKKLDTDGWSPIKEEI